MIRWLRAWARPIVRILLGVTIIAITAAALLWTRHHDGIYMTEVDVVVLPPDGDDPFNKLTDQSRGFVDLVGIVAKAVMGASSAPAPVSEDVTLVGMGIRDGWVVRQPNDGGQWNTSFSRPVLNVQATGPTPERALATLNSVVAKIRAQIDLWEATYRVEAKYRASVTLNPVEPALYYYNGDRNRAAVGIAVLGLLALIVVLRATRPRLQAVARRRPQLLELRPEPSRTVAARR